MPKAHSCKNFTLHISWNSILFWGLHPELWSCAEPGHFSITPECWWQPTWMWNSPEFQSLRDPPTSMHLGNFRLYLICRFLIFSSQWINSFWFLWKSNKSTQCEGSHSNISQPLSLSPNPRAEVSTKNVILWSTTYIHIIHIVPFCF